MKCAFCQTDNAPKANFCTNCGSPLDLQVCPKCETISDKTAATCMKCGYVLPPAEKPILVGAFTGSGTHAPPSIDDNLPAREKLAANWKELLHSLEEEVHGKLNQQTRLAAEDATDGASRLAPTIAYPILRKRIPFVQEATVVKPAQSIWRLPGPWLAVIGVAGSCYFFFSLPPPTISRQDALNPSASKPAIVGTDVAVAVPPSRDEAKSMRERAPSDPLATPEPAPTPPNETKPTAPEKRGYEAGGSAFTTTSNVPVYSSPQREDRDQPARVTPAASARYEPPAPQPAPIASGRLTFGSGTNARRPVGHLTLTVSPWGEVYVDSKKRGASPPLAMLTLPPGKHSVQIRNKSLPPYGETIELQAGQTLTIKHKFK